MGEKHAFKKMLCIFIVCFSTDLIHLKLPKLNRVLNEDFKRLQAMIAYGYLIFITI